MIQSRYPDTVSAGKILHLFDLFNVKTFDGVCPVGAHPNFRSAIVKISSADDISDLWYTEPHLYVHTPHSRPERSADQLDTEAA